MIKGTGALRMLFRPMLASYSAKSQRGADISSERDFHFSTFAWRIEFFEGRDEFMFSLAPVLLTFVKSINVRHTYNTNP